jgi:hypothetical protein
MTIAKRPAFQPVPKQASFAQPRETENRLILVIRRGVLSARREQQERLHRAHHSHLTHPAP